jgi:hypothetical protein
MQSSQTPPGSIRYQSPPRFVATRITCSGRYG